MTSGTPGPGAAAPPLTLTDLCAAWRCRWRTLAAGLLIGMMIAATAHLVTSGSYAAVAVVQVESSDPDLVDMAAEEAVATSRRVSAEARESLGDDSLTIAGLEAVTSARTVGSSHVMHVGFSAAKPVDAARGADALAQAYLAARAVDAAADDATAARPTGRIVDPARVPTAPSGPAAAAWLAAGAALGLGVTAPIAARPRTRPTRSQAARAS